MIDVDAQFILFLKGDVSEDQLIGLYRTLEDDGDFILKGTPDDLMRKSLYRENIKANIQWRESPEVLFFLWNEETDIRHFLLKGRRQFSLWVSDIFFLTSDTWKRRYDFTPVMCTICDSLDPFFAFGGSDRSVSGEQWIRYELDGSIDAAMGFLGDNGGFGLTTMYLDRTLYGAIGERTIGAWAEFDVSCGPHGRLISCRKDPYDVSISDRVDWEVERNRLFKKEMLPAIRSRFEVEYSNTSP